MIIRRTAIFFFLASSLFACDGATFRCDPSPSWSVRPDAGTPDDGGSSLCGSSCRAHSLAAGDRHTCAAVGDYGEVVCFGANESGQSSPLVPEDETLPVAPYQRIDPFSIDGGSRTLVAGALSTCVIYAGSVFCWGAGAVLGGEDRDPPRELAIEGVFQIQHAALHVLVTRGAREHATFGAWDGIDPTAAAPLDRPRSFRRNEGFLRVGGFTTWANSFDSSTGDVSDVVHGGTPPPGVFGAGDWNQAIEIEVEEIGALVNAAIGALHVCWITNDSSVTCLGLNSHGQLGRGYGDSRRHLEFEVIEMPTGELAAATLCVGGHLDVRADGDSIVIGSQRGGHTCALTATGALWCWGANDRGQLGDGTTHDHFSPVAIATAPRFTQLACGGEHTCAIDEAGDLWCWGDNSTGQLGVPSTNLAFRAHPERVSFDVIREP